MKAYVTRTGSRYEFAKQFGSRSIDDLLDEQEIEMILNKVPARKQTFCCFERYASFI